MDAFRTWVHDWIMTLRYGSRLTKAGRQLRRNMKLPLDEYVEAKRPE